MSERAHETRDPSPRLAQVRQGQHLVLILDLLLVAVEERVNVARLRVFHALSLSDELLHQLLVRTELGHQRRVRACPGAQARSAQGLHTRKPAESHRW